MMVYLLWQSVEPFLALHSHWPSDYSLSLRLSLVLKRLMTHVLLIKQILRCGEWTCTYKRFSILLTTQSIAFTHSHPFIDCCQRLHQITTRGKICLFCRSQHIDSLGPDGPVCEYLCFPCSPFLSDSELTLALLQCPHSFSSSHSCQT